MAELNWTSEAERWLRVIYDHITEDHPVAAIKVIERIYDRAQILLEFPQIGYRYVRSARDIRILLYGHYRIAHLVRPRERIDILGVFHDALTNQLERTPCRGSPDARTHPALGAHP